MTNKVMTWVLIMALLISQSYAYSSVPCESNGPASSQHNGHTTSNSSVTMQHNQPMQDMPDHKEHDTQQKQISMECCDQDCSCLSGTCASVTLTHAASTAALNTASDPSVYHLFILQDAFLPSLLKPPIFS
jgi:hypothetical protein